MQKIPSRLELQFTQHTQRKSRQLNLHNSMNSRRQYSLLSRNTSKMRHQLQLTHLLRNQKHSSRTDQPSSKMTARQRYMVQDRRQRVQQQTSHMLQQQKLITPRLAVADPAAVGVQEHLPSLLTSPRRVCTVLMLVQNLLHLRHHSILQSTQQLMTAPASPPRYAVLCKQSGFFALRVEKVNPSRI
jgi:hypothetical protein